MREEQKKIKRYVAISFWSHIVLFLLFSIGQWISPKPMLFQPTVQIDMVALPDQVKQSEPQPIDTTLPVKDKAPPPKPEPEEQKDDSLALEKPDPNKLALEKAKKKEAEDRAKEALRKLREQAKKNERKEEQKRQQALLDKKKEDLKRFEEAYRSAIRGNQTNQGTSASGEMQATMNAYAGHITERLRNNWSLPAWLQSQGLRAVMRIYIDSRGNVMRYQMMRSSGNDTFDEYVKGCVQRSTPFAPPPEEMATGLRNSGMEVLFPL